MKKEDIEFIEKSDSGIVMAKKDNDSFIYHKGNKDELITNLATLLATIEKENWLNSMEILEAVYLAKGVDKE